MEPAEYLQNKGISYKVQSGQLVFNCPFCVPPDQGGHLYMEPEDGMYHCKKCDERGNLITFKKHFGDGVVREHKSTVKPVQAVIGQFSKSTPVVNIPEKRVHETVELLHSDMVAIGYLLNDRKLSMETIKEFKLGLSVDKNGVSWLTIPHYENGKVINVKSRTLPPAEKTFRRVKDSKSILFNVDCLKKYKDRIIITEGEIDSLTLLSQGLNFVVGATNGAGSFDPEWIDQLKGVEKVYICYDSDEVGRKGAKELARRLGYNRCFNIVLPDGMDINDYFAKIENPISGFSDLVDNAKRYDVAGIKAFGDCLDQMDNEHNPFLLMGNGLQTGIAPLDRLNRRGMRGGELWVVAAPPGVGKSSLSLQIITNLALEGRPSLFFSMEMNSIAVTEKIVQAAAKKENTTKVDIGITREMFKNKPMYIGRVASRPNLEGIIEVLREAIKRYGLQIIAFDHLHFLCRSLTNQVQEIGLAVQAFKLLAEEMEIPIILVAQPRKVDLTKPMTAEDLKDSSSIHSDADGIIILHRKRITGDGESDKSLDPITMVRFEKTRYGKGGECLLYFHGEYSFFTELED